MSTSREGLPNDALKLTAPAQNGAPQLSAVLGGRSGHPYGARLRSQRADR
jgi:hypothetical protein